MHHITTIIELQKLITDIGDTLLEAHEQCDKSMREDINKLIIDTAFYHEALSQYREESKVSLNLNDPVEKTFSEHINHFIETLNNVLH